MKIIGHRGARGLAPENTTASFAKAIEQGVDMIETDLRESSDRVVVLYHNIALHSRLGKLLLVARTPEHILRRAKPDLATLDDLFTTLLPDRPCQLYLEVKARVPVERIAATVEAYEPDGFRPRDVFVASKSQRTLQELHRKLPRSPVIVIESWNRRRAMARAHQLDTRIIAMNARWLTARFVRSAARAGWQIYAYTLNNPVRAARLKQCGLAGVVTDYPDRMRMLH